MSLSPADILKRYWGYDSFRELQPQIIESVLSGHDTLGLLPTGGGKSITFQVPAMMLSGLTIVVTPLISLMKDQVDNLRARDIPAAAVHSGLTRAEHRLALDRCRLGKIRLLYLSPEKLQSERFIDELRLMDVSLIVVDEAHCISQWGYDFRPSYLKIERLRRYFPEAPVLALTASATPEVADDIMTQLRFRTRNLFARSFSRKNISYIVRYTDQKQQMLLRVLQATTGCAIVYVRSRRRSREIAEMLQREGISADFYHAGLAVQEKDNRQNRWKDDRVRVMVATNAFGMGIDKPDVRTVVHIDLPSSLEEYYQEAGRAGRDGLPSYAVVITNPSADKATLSRRLSVSFPEKETIRTVYEMAGNFLGIAVGEGYNHLFEFDFTRFCDTFGFRPEVVRSSLSLLTRAGYIEYVDEVATRSRIIVIMDKRQLYDLQLDQQVDAVFQNILRSYTGLFADYVEISEETIASRLQLTPRQVYESLLALARCHAINYVPRRSTPYIFYTTSRELPKHVELPHAVYEQQRQRMQHRLEAIKSFVFATDRCRVNTMLRYFGEQPQAPCGKCDVCRDRQKKNNDHNDRLRETIIYQASSKPPRTVNEVAHHAGINPEIVIDELRQLIDEGIVSISSDGHITLSD